MAKNTNHYNRFFISILCFCFSWLVLLPNYSFATTDPLNSNDPLTRLVYVYRSQIGVKELTGNNDGDQIWEYQKAGGIKIGQPWCAAYVAWCFQQAKIKAIKSGWSPAWFNAKYVIYKKGIASLQEEPQQGDVAGLYYSKLGRYGHTFFIDYWSKSNFCITNEGNSNEDGSRDGNKVVKKKRLKSQISVVARYLPKHNRYIP